MNLRIIIICTIILFSSVIHARPLPNVENLRNTIREKLARGEKVVLVNTVIDTNIRVQGEPRINSKGQLIHPLERVTGTMSSNWQEPIWIMADEFADDENFHVINLSYLEMQTLKGGEEVSILVPRKMQVLQREYKRKIYEAKEITTQEGYEYLDISHTYTTEEGSMFRDKYIKYLQGDVVRHIKKQGIKEVVLVGAMDENVIPKGISNVLRDNPDVHITVDPEAIYPYKTDKNGSPTKDSDATVKDITSRWKKATKKSRKQISTLSSPKSENACSI